MIGHRSRSTGPVRIINGYFVTARPRDGQVCPQAAMAGRTARLGAYRLAAHRASWCWAANVAPEDRDSYDPVALADTIHHTREGACSTSRPCWAWG